MLTIFRYWFIGWYCFSIDYGIPGQQTSILSSQLEKGWRRFRPWPLWPLWWYRNDTYIITNFAGIPATPLTLSLYMLYTYIVENATLLWQIFSVVWRVDNVGRGVSRLDPFFCFQVSWHTIKKNIWYILFWFHNARVRMAPAFQFVPSLAPKDGFLV